ncbi:alpha/beta hydrolase [Streptomyces sp. NPDC005892]|uniref:dienelactone hydrolase family protein n=1 Tax=Streptomyces sp. NPDC005892 TaxID=3155593 RepID=UPI003407B0F0
MHPQTHTLHFTAESLSDGVLERDFTVGDVPGVLWSPASASADPAPLILMAHAGGNDKKHPAMANRARLFVNGCGFHVAVLDAPSHGDRPRTDHDEQERSALAGARTAGESVMPVVVRYNEHLAARALPEMRAALDALQELPEIGTGGPVGFFGVRMGTAFGMPLVAADSRITAAVFGLYWSESVVETAKHITVPVEFSMQWDDEHIPREDALALFDAFASEEKTLHANAGKQGEQPRFESAAAVEFFARHFGRTVTSRTVTSRTVTSQH